MPSQPYNWPWEHASDALTADECERYARHISLSEIGHEGQLKLRRASVLVIGARGLGSPALLYLAAAGIGRIGIMDPDTVSLSNLQRQVVHSSQAVGEPKPQSAAESLRRLDPAVKLDLIAERLTPDNAAATIAAYDFVIDATDGLDVKFLINDTCVALGKPFCHGGIYRFGGQLLTWAPGHADLRALFGPDAAAPHESVEGPLGVVPGVIGTLQATEAVKVILGIGCPLFNTLLTIDLLAMTFNRISLR